MPPLTAKQRAIISCEKIRFTAIAVLALTVIEVIVGKIQNRLVIAPDFGIVLIISGLTFAGMSCLMIRSAKKNYNPRNKSNEIQPRGFCRRGFFLTSRNRQRKLAAVYYTSRP